MESQLGLIIAIVGSAVAIVGVMIALFLWTRGEANSDRRHFEDENKTLRRDLIDVMRSIDQEIKDFHTKLALQDKEFKMRLCAIEERRK